MQAIYQAKGLTKRYGHKTALDNLSFEVLPGRLVGLLGPNGSGKTTLLKLSAGLLRPSAGQVFIGGREPGVATKTITSYLPDRMALPVEMRVDDLVNLFADFYEDFDMVKASRMLADLKLDPRQRIGTMSKGTQEKMELCLVMSRAAKLYLLDEPLGGVDPAAREYILNTILRNYNEDAAVVISTHLVEDVERMLDEVLILKEGQLLAHRAVDELREESGMSLDEYFRHVFRV
ncbi:ABC transporter ATP-binding protein [uncultured Gemmiger sp.]|uniref:ABC transporter ATP-binding protein n=1 Tax=uncultured Gemmiger sp. TaxID=1623490 RepID=UPI0025D0BEA5|nr:ABC transporter ATP-binding protein [uncultured Gemmiger sp.]